MTSSPVVDICFPVATWIGSGAMIGAPSVSGEPWSLIPGSVRQVTSVSQVDATAQPTAAPIRPPCATRTSRIAKTDPRLNANPRVDEAHHKVAPAGFKYLVTEMLCWAAGGPQRYTGRDMANSHRHLAITAGEWDAFMDDLAQTLDRFQVPTAERAEVVALVQSNYRDIVPA